MAAPAKADQASARGAVTIVRPSGSSFSVSGEVTLPASLYYNGALTVTPTSTNPGTNQEVATLNVTPGEVTAIPDDAANSFDAQVTQELINATTIEDKATIIKAAVGADGISGGAMD